MSVGIRGGILKAWVTAAVIVFVGAAAALIAYVAADRSRVEGSAAKEILYDATLAATSLDAILRVASNELACLVESADIVQTHIDRMAFALPEAQNIYLLDGTGAVVATAYKRRDPIFPIDPALIERMKAGAILDTRIIDMPSEGGMVISLLRRIDIGTGVYSYAVALYTGYTLRSGISMLLSTAYGVMSVADAYGTSLPLVETQTGSEPLPAVSGPGDPLTATVALANVPLKIQVSVDKSALFSEWRSRTIVLCSVAIVSAMTVSIMLAVALALWKRGIGAERLRKDIESRDTLFREINHRVKNNLTIVQTVLEMGASGIDDHPERAFFFMRSAIDRLRAIALLHELLSSHATDAREDVGSYMRNLVDAIAGAYASGDRIRIVHRHEEGMRCGLDRMVPLALIVNELLTNAYKYAFPGNMRGMIQIDARRAPDGGLLLEIQDDGIGMDAVEKRPGGIGTMLIEALVGQIGATIERVDESGSGTHWRIVVPPEAAAT